MVKMLTIWRSNINDGNFFFKFEIYWEYSKTYFFRHKRKRPEESDEDGASKKQKKRNKDEKLPPLPVELVNKMKALIDYIVEYEDK